jgi:hypothetical protein
VQIEVFATWEVNAVDSETIKGGLGIFTTAIGGVKTLIDIAGSVKNSEMKQHASEVLEKLTEARVKSSELHDKYIASTEENRQLRAKLGVKDEVRFHDGACWRKHSVIEEGPFCSACWEADNKLIRGQVNSVDRGEVQFFCANPGQPYLYNVPENLVSCLGQIVTFDFEQAAPILSVCKRFARISDPSVPNTIAGTAY